MSDLRTLTDADLRARFDALIRKKYPYQPGKPRRTERRVTLSPEEERELMECAHEDNRRESSRIHKRWLPKQLDLF